MEAIYLDLFPAWAIVAWGVLFGLLCGSFLNVVIYRLPRGLSLSVPGSHCPHCEKKIAPYDNVPVLAYLWLRGRSRCCHQKISIRYPLIEALGGLTGGAVATMKLVPFAHQLTMGETAFVYWLYLSITLALIAAAAIDLEHMLLPDSITWGGAALGLLTSPWRSEVDPWLSGCGAVVGFLGIWFPFIWLHEKVRGFAGMGLGDAKLMALAGAWFGPWGALVTLFGGALQGTVFAGIALLLHGKLEEPQAVTEQREEMRRAIEEAEGEEKAALIRELEADPLGAAPEDQQGGPRIAFGPFLALTLIEMLLFYEPLKETLYDLLYI